MLRYCYNFSSLIIIIIIITSFFFFFFIKLASGQDDEGGFIACSNVYACGSITYIGYPFSGYMRPDHCGHPYFHLTCSEGTSEIQIMSVNYRVLSISMESRTMRIARTDFFNDFDSSFPCPTNYNDSILNSTFFQLSPTSSTLTLFYNCGSAPANQSGFSSYQFGCGNESDNYFYGVPRELRSSCRWRVEVEVLKEGMDLVLSGKASVSQVLKEGFDVEFNDLRNVVGVSECVECERSGGRCGFNSTSQKLVCFCFYGHRSDTWCLLSPSVVDAKQKKNLIVRLTVGIGAFIILATLILFCLFMRPSLLDNLVHTKMKNKNIRNVEAFLMNYETISLKRYKFSDIKKMTNSFQEKLGQGGYGSVFKGELLEGHMVAVKLLSESKGNGEEFINEIVSISRISHINIVSLIGFCVEGTHRALIYEFMPNGSLEKFIHDKTHTHLGWKTLYKIAMGIARGLEYLHRDCSPRILHFDIKPHNILLDKDFCPKISDFGLSKLFFMDESMKSMTQARGTAGYIAPELVVKNFEVVSHKSDVYSYGMMVFEIVGGRKNLDLKAANSSQIYFPHWAYKRLDQSTDLKLEGVTTAEDEEIARKLFLVGLWCVQNDPVNRPPMNIVLEMLEGSLYNLQIPPDPFLSSHARSQEVFWNASIS